MNLHTKEVILDVLSLIGNIFLILVSSWLVVFHGFSKWWFVLFFLARFRYATSEWIREQQNKDSSN